MTTQALRCSTTGQEFVPLSTWEQHIGAHTFVWCYCPHCDRHCRPRSHPEFDPLEPQPHCYALTPSGELWREEV